MIISQHVPSLHLVKFLIHDGFVSHTINTKGRNVIQFSEAICGEERCMVTLKMATGVEA